MIDYGLIFFGLLIIVFGLRAFSVALETLMVTMVLLVAVCLTEFFKVELASADELFFAGGSIDPADGVIFASVLLVQWEFVPYSNALIAVVLGVLFGRLIRTANLGERFLAQVARAPVVFYLTFDVFSFFDRRIGEPLDKGQIDLLKIIPLAIAALFYLALQLGLDGFITAWKKHTSARWYWVEAMRFQAPVILSFVSLGTLAALTFQPLLYQHRYPLSLVFFTLLMLGVLYLCQLDVGVRRAYQAAVKTLSSAIELQNPHAAGHGERVVGYALAVARDLGIHGKEYESLGYSSLLHDIGKAGINEDSLDAVLESTALSEGELLHAQLGSEIVSQVGFLKDNAEVIKKHHKPFSSHKTSAREAGTIPESARIINVADTFDQLVEARLLEERLTPDEAAARLKKESGLLLDPKIVRVFLALLRKKGFLSEGGLRRR